MKKMSLEEIDLLSAVNKSMINAEDLIADADLLVAHQRLPRAYTLFQLAMEETGKALKIYCAIILGLPKTTLEQKKLREDFTDHIEKAQSARGLTLLGLEAIAESSPQLAEYLMNMTLKEYTDPQTLNRYKNYSLYTSWVQDSYKTPKEVITEDRVSYISIMAKNRFAVASAIIQSGLSILDQLKQTAIDNPLTAEQLSEQLNRRAEELHHKLHPDITCSDFNASNRASVSHSFHQS